MGLTLRYIRSIILSQPAGTGFRTFLPLNVSTNIPPSNSATPNHDVELSCSPTTTTLKIAAVSGSASDNVTAEDDGMRFNPAEKRMYAALVEATPR